MKTIHFATNGAFLTIKATTITVSVTRFVSKALWDILTHSANPYDIVYKHSDNRYWCIKDTTLSFYRVEDIDELIRETTDCLEGFIDRAKVMFLEEP